MFFRITAIVTFFILASLAPLANAERTLRVLWDVAQNEIFCNAIHRDGVTTDTLRKECNATGNGEVIEVDLAGVGEVSFIKITENTRLLRKDDKVEVYLVNYNPVAHKPGKPEVTPEAPEVPEAIGVLAGITGVLTGGELESLGIAPAPPAAPPLDPDLEQALVSARAACDSNSPGFDCLGEIRDLSLRWKQRLDWHLASNCFRIIDNVGKRVGEIPAELWSTFDSKEALEKIAKALDDAATCGNATDFEQFERAVRDGRTEVKQWRDAVNALLFDFDRKISVRGLRRPFVWQRLISERELVGRIVEQLNRIVQESRAGTDSQWIDKLKNFDAIVKAARSYEEQLRRDTLDSAGSSSSVPLERFVVRARVGSEKRLSIDWPFASSKGGNRQLVRSLKLESEMHYPAVLTTIGASLVRPTRGFDFRKVTLEEINQEGEIKKRFSAETRDTTYEWISTSFLTSIQLDWVRPLPKWLYASVGTTADRNVFKNLILAGSAYVPDWRALFSVGVIGARGSKLEDIQEAAAVLSDPSTGFALEDASTDGITTVKWSWQFVFAVSFNPF